MVKPSTPKPDKHVISPNSITSELHIKVMRIKKMVTKYRSSWLLNEFSFLAA